MYAAGADSTNALITSFILVMTLYPEIQQRAQEEIDRVVGTQRLPAIEDRANLPYVECIIREVYRWNPASPLSVPHRLLRNDEYESHMIPEGTIIIPNIWCDVFLLHSVLRAHAGYFQGRCATTLKCILGLQFLIPLDFSIWLQKEAKL